MQHSSSSNFKVGNKVCVKAQFFQTTRPSKKLSEKYLRPYEIIAQPNTLLFTFCLLESICSVHPVFHMFILKPTTSNSFSKRTQLSSLQMVDLVFLYFIFIFIFFLIYFLNFLFLEHRVRVSDGHESRDTWNKIEGSRTNDIIQHGYHILISCSIHGYLGQGAQQ